VSVRLIISSMFCCGLFEEEKYLGGGERDIEIGESV